MINKRAALIAAAVLLALLAVTPSLAVAQEGPVAQSADTPPADPAGDTTSASVNLRAGFILDPYLLPVVGNGETAAADVQKGCNGFVGADPDVVVNWSGKTEQLSFFDYSDADPVLVVQKPDGSFVCNDDAGLNTVQPLVTVKSPVEGAYKIYVGTARQDAPALGFLGITAMPLDDDALADLDLRPMLTRRQRPQPQPLPRLDPASLLTSRPGVFGSADLKAGFQPVQKFAAGGGDIAAFTVENQQLVCAGFVSLVPSYSFTWSGKAEPLRLFFEAKKDSSLAVVTPDQQVLCNMNAAEDNLNPALDIPEPATGRYKVYIASMAPGEIVAGRLTVTGDAQAAPTTLAPAAQ